MAAQQQSWHQKLITMWASPAGFLVFFGALVWGIQLNVGFVQLTSRVTGIEAQQRAQVDQMSAISENMLRITLTLDNMLKDIEHNTEQIDQHNAEAEKWKRKISVMEDRTGC